MAPHILICVFRDDMSKNKTLTAQMPLVAAHALLVTGHRDFEVGQC